MQILREKLMAMSKSKGVVGVLGCDTRLWIDVCPIPFQDVAAALSYGIQMMSLDSMLGTCLPDQMYMTFPCKAFCSDFQVRIFRDVAGDDL